MKFVAVALFLAGLLLGVRVMFFGVQRRLTDERVALRDWPFGLSAALVAAGLLLYFGPASPTAVWVALLFLISAAAGGLAIWIARRSAAAPSSDPDDDPRFRFQGHIARVVEPISQDGAGRIAFEFDGRRHELRARWSTESPMSVGSSRADDEVVIERVDDDTAYVEPWAVVEQRL